MQNQKRSEPVQAKQLFDELTQDSTSHHLSQSRREEILEQYKILGRNPTNVRKLCGATEISVLGSYAFGTYPSSTSREALRCLANALLLFPQAQQAFVQNGFAPRATEALRNQNDDDEFLLSRILFLLTYNKFADFTVLIDKHGLAESIIAHIDRHAREIQSHADGNSPLPPGTEALAESLKLLFNVMNAKPEYSTRFSNTIPNLLQILSSFAVPSPPLQPPLIYIINALANLDFQLDQPGNIVVQLDLNLEKLAPAVEKLVSILDLSIEKYKPKELETQIIPLLTVLRRINDAAAEMIGDKMRSELLPKDNERDLPLGKSSTVASRLLQLTTSAGLANLPEVISALLFELSNKDAGTYIKNVGYGYAAGYLMTHKITIPESVNETQIGRDQVPINPVTGQRLDKEPSMPALDMTEEEKEREAERLFILFERLKKTGVIDAKNPVQQAMEEGRFEEVSDSD